MRVNRVALSRYVFLLGLSYVAFLGATAPAILLRRILPAKSGITLEHLTGTVWHGAVQKMTFPSNFGFIQVRDLTWDWQWLYLFHRELAFKLESANAAGNVIVARNVGGLRLVQADITLPAAELAQIVPSLTIWQPDGEVQFQTQGFTLTANSTSEARLIWRHAALNLSPLQPLGDYRLHLRNTHGEINFQLETQQGKLKLEGTGTYSRQDGLQFKGMAQTDAPYAADLKTLLDIMGSDRGDGVHIINLAQH